MDLATQTHLTTLRTLLTERLHTLRAEVRAAELSQEELTEAAHEATDRKDEATQRQLLDVDGAQERLDAAELAAVENALDRLDRGVYGDCADCGQPIALQRLLVQPAAQRCAPCQSARESRPRRG